MSSVKIGMSRPASAIRCVSTWSSAPSEEAKATRPGKRAAASARTASAGASPSSARMVATVSGWVMRSPRGSVTGGGAAPPMVLMQILETQNNTCAWKMWCRLKNGPAPRVEAGVQTGRGAQRARGARVRRPATGAAPRARGRGPMKRTPYSDHLLALLLLAGLAVAAVARGERGRRLAGLLRSRRRGRTTRPATSPCWPTGTGLVVRQRRHRRGARSARPDPVPHDRRRRRRGRRSCRSTVYGQLSGVAFSDAAARLGRGRRLQLRTARAPCC